ncbi:Superoxide dismutase 1 copper chaperone [Yarrowia sp. C11]|nr:Superoxide dismutase 1 copper chaperone [Yarrowia sp. E02]KAG5371317.1 Superoxide dismutase 1 copper chaperone [Yarrowia sp. C11]
MSFTTTFAVPLECESCCDSVKQALANVQGIESVDCKLVDQLISVTGTSAPSQIVKAVQNIGKDAIVRGTGQPNSAAVCILESHAPEDQAQPIKGLARIVSVSKTLALIDITLNGLPKGTYYPSIRVSGDISDAPQSLGGVYQALGSVEVNETDSASGLFSGQAFVKSETQISSLIGRGMAVSTSADVVKPQSLVGVIARSAGVWENDKTVCSCSGKTVWEERKDAQSKGLEGQL